MSSPSQIYQKGYKYSPPLNASTIHKDIDDPSQPSLLLFTRDLMHDRTYLLFRSEIAYDYDGVSSEGFDLVLSLDVLCVTLE